MYQHSLPLGPNVERWLGFKWMMDFIPGGAIGVFWRSNGPWIYSCADISGLMLLARSILAWGPTQGWE